jgi:hypothetical protein
MAAVLGISFPELLGTPPGVLNILPPSVLKFTRQLNLVRTESSITENRTLHIGFAQLPDPLVDLGTVKFFIPALKDGLPFRFFIERVPPRLVTIENQPVCAADRLSGNFYSPAVQAWYLCTRNQRQPTFY